MAFKLRMKAAASRMPEIDGMDDLLAGLLDEEDEWQEGGEEEAQEVDQEVPGREEMEEQQVVEVETYAEEAVEELTEAAEEEPKEKKRKKKKKKEKQEAEDEVPHVNEARMGSNVKDLHWSETPSLTVPVFLARKQQEKMQSLQVPEGLVAQGCGQADSRKHRRSRCPGFK